MVMKTKLLTAMFCQSIRGDDGAQLNLSFGVNKLNASRLP